MSIHFCFGYIAVTQNHLGTMPFVAIFAVSPLPTQPHKDPCKCCGLCHTTGWVQNSTVHNCKSPLPPSFICLAERPRIFLKIRASQIHYVGTQEDYSSMGVILFSSLLIDITNTIPVIVIVLQPPTICPPLPFFCRLCIYLKFTISLFCVCVFFFIFFTVSVLDVAQMLMICVPDVFVYLFCQGMGMGVCGVVWCMTFI